MKIFPLGPKRIKLSNHHNGRHDYSEKEKDQRKIDETVPQEELPKNN